jgi:hypothetical protein
MVAAGDKKAQVLTASGDLFEQSERFKTEVDGFIAEVRAA